MGACPLIQCENQKLSFSPLPIVTRVEAWKRALSVLSQGTSSPAHGLSTCFQRNHSHLSLKALAKRSSSRIPSPPRSLGAQVDGQLTRQWPPLNFSGSSPFHKKLRRILSICRINHFCVAKTVRWYISCEVKTLFTNVSRPVIDSNLPFHPEIRAPQLVKQRLNVHPSELPYM